MVKQVSKKLIAAIEKYDSHILISLIVTTTLLSYLGLGFKNAFPASILTILYCLIKNPKLSYQKSPTTYISILFLFLFNISFFFNQTPYGFYEFLTFNTGAFLFLTVSSHPPSDIRKVTSKLSMLTIPVSLFSIMNLIKGPIDRSYGVFKGVESYISYPNAFADFLLLIILTNLGLIFTQKSKSKLLYISLFINSIAFWLTQSRGAYISLLIGLFIGAFLLIISKNNLKAINPPKKYLLILLIISLSIPTAFSINKQAKFYQDPLARISSEDISASRSSSERPSFWLGAIQITKDNLLVGTGSGSFQYIYPTYQSELLVNAPHPHNLFLKISSENGLFTSLSLLLLIITACFHPFITKNYAHLFLLPSVLSINAHHLIDYNLNFPVISILLFIFLGLLANKPAPNIQSSKLSKIFLATFVMICTLQFIGFLQVKRVEQGAAYNPNLLNLVIFPHQLYEQDFNSNSADIYPNFHPVLFQKAKQEISQENPNPVYIERALLLNSMNDFSYHLLFLNTLEKLNKQQEIIQKSEYYFDLSRQYISLLEVNTHNTITTNNPSQLEGIIDLYIAKPNLVQNKDWVDLKTDLQYIYNKEKTKFKNRFNQL